MSDSPTQGPRAGANWPAEDEVYSDPNTGARVRRLTGYPGAGNLHPYFTEPCVYDGGRRMVLSSTRSGDSQVFSIDLETGLLTQLTDVPPPSPRGTSSRPAIAEDGDVACRWSGDHMVAVDLDTLEVRSLYEKPADYNGKIAGVNADGTRVYASIVENVRDRTGDDWMAEKFELGPHSQVLSIPIERVSASGTGGGSSGEGTESDGGEAEVIYEEDTWIGHVNPSPTDPDLMTYCEEGPWHRVDNRIWVLNAETGERWPIRETPEGSGVGHEYWLGDGERIGYHGFEGSDEDRRLFAGSARYDDTDYRETEIPVRATHTNAHSPELIVVDGSPDVPVNLLYRWDDEAGEYEPPRMLATHDWGRGSPHPHSRMLPDESGVVFDSNRHAGDSDPYLAEIPDDFEELPVYEED